MAPMKRRFFTLDVFTREPLAGNPLAVVVDCETGRFRLGLAAQLAARLGAECLPVGEVSADAIAGAITRDRAA